VDSSQQAATLAAGREDPQALDRQPLSMTIRDAAAGGPSAGRDGDVTRPAVHGHPAWSRLAQRHAAQRGVLALPAFVIVLDQAMKWWAWRHVSGAMINNGGNAFVGATLSGWYVDPVKGAVLDLLDFGVLSIAIALLVRRRRPLALLVPGALMIGGWSSNLLDRLGLHYWTAPGSVRGAVDFIDLGRQCYNVADFFIVGATPLFLLAAAGYLYTRAADRRAATGSVAPAMHRRPRARTRMSALAGALGVIVVVGIGAANYGGVTAPAPSARGTVHP
jgi:lipoprotein signal peptidase